MNDVELESEILGLLSPINPIWSNALFRKLGGNKARFQKTRDKMIEAGWIRSEVKNGRMYLTRLNFESSKFEDHDWTDVTRENCNNFLDYLRDRKPLFTGTKNKKIRTKKLKEILDAFFQELDRQMIVNIRLVNAEALELILADRARLHQIRCVDLVHEFINRLLYDHREFREEIKEYAQSLLRTVQFKI